MSPPPTAATTSSDVVCHRFTPFIIPNAHHPRIIIIIIWVSICSSHLHNLIFLEMAGGRKGKNIMINDEAATHATKRRRIQLMNAEFPSTNLHPRNTDLQLSPPVEETPNTDDDDVLISQQNYLINYHTNEMQRSVEEFWRTNLSNEIKRRKEMERRLQEKEEQMVRFRDMYYYYEDRAFLLEEKLNHMVAAQGCNTRTTAGVGVGVGVGVEEEVDSCYVVDRGSLQLACLNCLNRPATMVWLPCRHLCVCLVCERRVKNCPVCGAKKTDSIIINALP